MYDNLQLIFLFFFFFKDTINTSYYLCAVSIFHGVALFLMTNLVMSGILKKQCDRRSRVDLSTEAVKSALTPTLQPYLSILFILSRVWLFHCNFRFTYLGLPYYLQYSISSKILDHLYFLGIISLIQCQS